MINQLRDSKIACPLCLPVSSMSRMVRNSHSFEASCQFCAYKVLFDDTA